MKDSQNSTVRKQLRLRTGQKLGQTLDLQDIEVANKHLKRCLTPPAIVETQPKTTRRPYYTPLASLN